MAACKSHFWVVIQRTVAFLLVLCASASLADVPNRIFPFTIFENGLIIEGVDFGQVPQASFHQRFIVITNSSSHELKNVVMKITGSYTVSNCMSVFLPGTSCNVILNYKAPAHESWDIKWLNIEFTVQKPDNSIHSDSQRLPVVGGVKLQADQPDLPD
jgi:hypothetical protein